MLMRRIAKISVVAIVAILVMMNLSVPVPATPPQIDDCIIYGVNYQDNVLSMIDPTTGTVTTVGELDPDPLVFLNTCSMAVRPSDYQLFVWSNHPNTQYGGLATVDRFTGEATRITSAVALQGEMQSLAFTQDGVLYGTGFRIGQPQVICLYEIDTATGARTEIGEVWLGSARLRPAGADFHPVSGELYAAELATGATQRLVTIDITTGTATLVATLSEDVGVIGSIVFHPSGILFGSGFNGPMGDIIYQINPVTGVVFNIRPLTSFAPQGMGILPKVFGTIYGVTSADNFLSKIDPWTGTVTTVGELDPDPLVFLNTCSMAVRPSDYQLFVWSNNPMTQYGGLATVDRFTGRATRITSVVALQGVMGSLAFKTPGALFGTGIRIGQAQVYCLYRIDTATGVRTEIGEIWLGTARFRPAGSDFHPVSGELYAAELTTGTTQRLVTIDVSTGTATLVATLSQNVGVIGSIVFHPSGFLYGSGFNGPMGDIIFRIDPGTGAVSYVRSLTGFAPQGMGIMPLELDGPVGMNPGVLQLRSQGRWITMHIEGPPESFDPYSIDISTILLEDMIPVDWGQVTGNKLLLKFDRSELQDILTPGTHTLKITGQFVDGTPFVGYTDEIRVIG